MIFKSRAFLSIIRKPGKSVILFLLVFLLNVFLSTGISIGHAIYETESNLRAQLPLVATFEWDFRSVGDFDGKDVYFEFPTVDMMTEVGNLPYVRSYDFRSESWLYSRDLEWVLPRINQDLIPDGMTERELVSIHAGFHENGGDVEMFPVMGINNSNWTDEKSINFLSCGTIYDARGNRSWCTSCCYF